MIRFLLIVLVLFLYLLLGIPVLLFEAARQRREANGSRK